MDAALKAVPRPHHRPEVPVQEKLQDTVTYLQAVLNYGVIKLADVTAQRWADGFSSLLTDPSDSLMARLHLRSTDDYGQPFFGCLPKFFYESAASSRKMPITRSHT